MTEWIGQLVATWPAWTAIPVAILVGIILLFWYAFIISDWPFTKKEWWQDRQKRLEKEASAQQQKQAKKG